MTDTKMELPGLNCEVCGNEALGVASSGLGPISFAFCRECLKQGAEPAWLLYQTVKWMVGGLDQCADWVHSVSTFFDGRYQTCDEFMAVNRDDIFPDPMVEYNKYMMEQENAQANSTTCASAGTAVAEPAPE